MSYTWYASIGSDIILAPCLQALCAEIAASPKYSQLTNLGEIGDSRHIGEGTRSDHNPIVTHNGKGYIRAIDLGGDISILKDLRAFINTKYNAHDPRLWPFGYTKGPDSLITNWTPNGQTPGLHVDTGDEGHLHISVNQSDGYNPGPNNWVAALEDRSPWGLYTPDPDLLEYIMKLDPTSAEYKRFVNDVSDAVAAKVLPSFNVDGNGDRHALETYLKRIPGYVPIPVDPAPAKK